MSMAVIIMHRPAGKRAEPIPLKDALEMVDQGEAFHHYSNLYEERDHAAADNQKVMEPEPAVTDQDEEPSREYETKVMEAKPPHKRGRPRKNNR